jgi:hypothetical protein
MKADGIAAPVWMVGNPEKTLFVKRWKIQEIFSDWGHPCRIVCAHIHVFQ